MRDAISVPYQIENRSSYEIRVSQKRYVAFQWTLRDVILQNQQFAFLRYPSNPSQVVRFKTCLFAGFQIYRCGGDLRKLESIMCQLQLYRENPTYFDIPEFAQKVY